MELNQWKVVLFEWIKATELIDIFGSIEHIRVEEFFSAFYFKLFGDTSKNRENLQIGEFLKESFPHYEALYDETRNISPLDNAYVLSLLLYYSCVLREDEFFQKCCKTLNAFHQLSIVRFFEHCSNIGITKESLRKAIKECIVTPSPQKTASIFSVSPRKGERQQLTVVTPNKEVLNQKLKEIRALKMQLDNERYERSMLEVEAKQNEQKIEHLVFKCKTLEHETQTLRAELLADKHEQHVSPSRNHRENQLRNKMQREIQIREDLIANLRCDNDTLTAASKKHKAHANLAEKQLRELRHKIRDLDASLEELQCDAQAKDTRICELEEEKRDLLDFINETRSSVRDTSVSSDSCSLYHTLDDSDVGESLAKSVVEVQLRERDAEVLRLQSEVEELSGRLKSDEEVLKERNEENQQLRASVKELTEKLRDMQIEDEIEGSLVADTIAENEQLRRKFVTLTIENEEVLKKFTILKSKSEEKVKKNQELTAEIAKLNENLRQELENSSNLHKQLESEKSLRTKASEENQSLTLQLQKSKQHNEELHETWNSEKKTLKWEIEVLKAEGENGKREVREAMEVKLNSIKETMKDICARAIENFNSENKSLLSQIESLKQQVNNFRNVEAELNACKKDKSFLLSKLRFSDKNFEMDALTGSIGMRQNQKTEEREEKFDNAYLNDLKLGTPFDEILKGQSSPSSERPSSVVQVKRRSRLSFNSLKNAFKVATQSNSTKKKTSTRLKSIVSHFSRGKDEPQSSRSRRKRLNRTLTPKNLRQSPQNWTKEVEDDEEEEHQQQPAIKREIELDRRHKRNLARDRNRPNLEDCDDTTVETATDIDTESDWMEEEVAVIAVSTPKCDKSLKYLRSFNSGLRKTISARSSDALERFDSCRSLNSLPTPSKSCTRSFVDTHIAVVNRMSDYSVAPIIRKLRDDHYEEKKSYKKFLPLTAVGSAALGMLCFVYRSYFRREE